MKPLAVIPARAGSKGIPGKNWKILNGKPLIQYTIEAALKCFQTSEICITTDAPQVIEIAEKLGVPVHFVRPNHLSSDTAGSREVLLHALDFWEAQFYKPDAIVLLQPTSPLRSHLHIKEALEIYSAKFEMVVGVKETKANPYYVLREENEHGFLIPSKKGTFTRRQDCPKVFEINGAIYAINPISLREKQIGEFERVVKYEMDEISSHDIDNAFDWMLAEILLKQC